MKILVVNDDGISSPGIKALANELSKIGEVTVSAPLQGMSGAGHGLSINKVLRVEKQQFAENITGYAVEGTPRDCAELGINAFMKDGVDLLVTGINQGSNLSNNIPCSGTCGAACTGLDYGVPAIAVSLDFGDEYDYRYSAEIAREMAEWFIVQPFNHKFVLNVNVPNRPREEIKGYHICGHGGNYIFHQDLTPRYDGRYYYYDTSSSEFSFVNLVENLDGDIYALHQGYITLSPIRLDMISYDDFPLIQKDLNQFKY
ncbi:MAG: 5'/3'-nucleotidase SurE [Erysipelotrichaceae bacterium]|nr:5'/3'-nucleotidase SurE [Erysipelotrichaceae bacterium]